jgi:AcrR family transcriptional regulator
MAAAREMFSDRAYTEVSVGQLIEKAGLQAPTLYHHYGDKEGLFVAWATDAFARVGGHVARSLAGTSTTKHSLQAFAKALIESHDLDLPGVLREARRMMRPESNERIMNAYFQHIFEPLCGVLVLGFETGEVAAGPVDRLADLFIAGTLVFNGSIGRAGTSPSEDARWLVERFLRGAGS